MVVNFLPTSQLMQVVKECLHLWSAPVAMSGESSWWKQLREQDSPQQPQKDRDAFLFFIHSQMESARVFWFSIVLCLFSSFCKTTIQKEEEWNTCANSNTSLNPAKNIRYVEQGCTRSKRQEQPLHLIQLATEVGKRKNLEQCKNGTSDLCGEGDPWQIETIR